MSRRACNRQLYGTFIRAGSWERGVPAATALREGSVVTARSVESPVRNAVETDVAAGGVTVESTSPPFGGSRQMQFEADLPVGATVGDLRQDLRLPPAELAECRCLPPALVRRDDVEPVKQAPGHGRADHGVTGGDRSDAVGELGF
jgi:hypothetical protein